jgi:hypothetical protein
MNQIHHRRKIAWLIAAVLLAIVFNVILAYRPALTGNDELNGLSGVCLGLFISSLPAANFLDMLLFEHTTRFWRNLTRPDVAWVVLNVCVLGLGMVVVMIGTKLFFKNW